eukprot:Nitzschia sp. Nitz4//scaffold114_size70088//41625//46588//NITZ4_005981-RA/size70088-augustus-gene-0.6-mRNA-1//1//CDS//3329533435//5441//frame0
MAPNVKSQLLYENDDMERVESFVKKGYRSLPILFINGQRVADDIAAKARSNQTLLSFLREDMGLKGSKLGCAEGGCGACTVMISKLDKKSGKIVHYNVNACLMPILAADGCHVTTVEGIGSVDGAKMHPIQKAMTELHGSQCGYCTPGIIVSIYSLYANRASMKEIEEHLDGNLCRCTGYRPIWDAARSLCDGAEDLVRGPCGVPCRECPERDTCTQDCNLEDKDAEAAQKDTVICSSSKDKMVFKDAFVGDQSDWLEQPNELFPNELVEPSSAENEQLAKPLMVVDRTKFQGAGTWFKPDSFEGLLGLLKEFGGSDSGGYKIVVGNTEVGIETKFKNSVYSRLIYPSDAITELYGFSAESDQVVFGACTSLSTIQHESGELGNSQPHLSRTLLPIHDMLRWFASTQIRNVACLGGNLATASPISDMNPMLASMGAMLVIAKLSDDGTVSRRSKPVSEFFLKYRTVDIQPSEIIEKVEVPVLAKAFEYVKPFKQARRREDDISIVTSGMKIRLVPSANGYVIEHIAMAFGGMAPTTVMAEKTAKSLIGADFSRSSFVKAQEVLMEELSLPESVPGGQAAYRMTLAASFLYKFYIMVVDELQKDVQTITENPGEFGDVKLPLPAVPVVDETEKSVADSFLSAEKPSFSGSQMYPAPKCVSGLEDELLDKEDSKTGAGAVGKGSVHQSGSLHCTGEAVYTDDIASPSGTVHAALILAKQSGVVFESIDADSAKKIPGVVGVCTAVDIDALGGDNMWGGGGPHDEYIFLPTGEVVPHVGATLGVVVAETLESAELAARLVVVKYSESANKVIMTIEDAIAANSYYDFTRHKVTRGDASLMDKLWDSVGTGGTNVGDVVTVSGEFHSGAQEHFYLEPNATLAVPSDGATNLTLYCSTQAASKTQSVCAAVTGTPASKVVCRVKRLGGGFGGKESRTIFSSCAAGVAAKRTNRPVRLAMARNVDMLTTGHRHAFVSHYCASATITEEGAKLLSMDVKVYNNGGSASDLSGPVADRALFHIDNSYLFPNLRVEVVCCKTAQAPHTAYRGFGGPQGMVVAEHVLEHLAVACGVPMDKMRRDNLYKDGESTHFGMKLGPSGTNGKWNVPAMYDRLYSTLDVPKRREEMERFNAKNKWLKRGCALVPTKFGINYTAKFMNQGGALVHLYTDGTVLVSHGGTEMGQGLHTKVCQVAAQAFGIPVEHVYVNDSSSDKVANAIPTAASMGTDLYGMCTLDACRQIVRRLKPYYEKFGEDTSLAKIANAAFFDRVDLTAHGFYAPEDARVGFDFDKPKPDDCPADAPENSWKGHPFNYFTQGVAYSEVEIDTLTGNHRTLRSDLIVDVGSSINPAIDIGQIEGAFTQGMGWSTIEDVVYGDDDHTWVRPRGNLFTAGPGTYKIPAFNDQPEVFNVTLQENVDNPYAVHSSKAIGEPPFFLGTSVFYAIKDAIRSARRANEGGDKETYFEMRHPATSERIRLYANDEISKKARVAMLKDAAAGEGTYQPQGSY